MRFEVSENKTRPFSYKGARMRHAGRVLLLLLLTLTATLVGAETATFPLIGYLKTWRQHVLRVMRERCGGATAPPSCANSDIYEFGVFTGRALRALTLHFNASRVGFRQIWGFDSFQGLPRETARNGTMAAVIDGGFQEGAFNVASVQSRCRWKHCRGFAAGDPVSLVGAYINDPRVNLIPGFFDRSLTRSLAHERGMRPALYVDIDVDLYSSAYAALDWLFANGLVVPGTVIGYDDWGYGLKLTDKRRPSARVNLQKLLLRGDPSQKAEIEHADGEPRAHREIAAKYGVVFRAVTYAATGSSSIIGDRYGPLWMGIVKDHIAAALFEVVSIATPTRHGASK